VAFPLIALTVWVALRFDTTIVVVHDLLVGIVAVLFTLHGTGPFANVPDDATRGLIVQAFVGLVAVVGLILALGRDEREVLLARMRHQTAQATQLAEHTRLLAEASRELFTAEDPRTAVLGAARTISGADGAYLLEPDGQGNLLTTAVVGLDMPPVTISIDAETSVTVTAFEGTEFVFVSDVPTHPGISRRIQEALDVASAAWQPVLAAGSTSLGVIGLIWHQEVEALPEHVPAMVQTLAAEAAHAIERGDLLLQLATAAQRDPLTGLANRRRWDEQIAGEVARASRGGVPLSVVLIDLDHFKRYNDTLGHLAGDGLLRDFATAADECLREIDTIARWGGEEFVVALPGCTAEQAVVVADRIRAVVPHGQTCTIGIAQWVPGDTPADVVDAADTALYEGKHAGRNRSVVSAR